MDVVETLQAVAEAPGRRGRLVHTETLPARSARTASLGTPLPGEVTERLAARGIDSLFTHQAAAIDHLRAHASVVVATGTASGKSLCYQVPIVESVVAGRRDTALLVFPTKALAQDQLRSLRSWLVPGLRAVTYDGDTGTDDRTWARKHANVVLTNPEMLHVGILPSHQRWATFLKRLRYVVVDELHTLRGIFGSHVAHVLRRLRRLCEHYGADPTFCFASATTGNPGELASALCGLPVVTIDDDASPRAERVLACWQRPLLDDHTGTRASANAETADLLAEFVAAGHQTLAFTRSRRGAELVAQHARRRLGELSPSTPATAVAAYRAGYLPEERRALERSLANGDLLGVAATNALELGIDVGGLDAVVLNGFPGTLASMWQQAGRAGRAGRRAAAVLVAGDDQLDQWYATHPTELARRAPERAVVNPQNPYVLRAHVACAAHERPLANDDERWFGDGLDDAVRDLVLADRLRPRGGRMYWAGERPPAPEVGLRTGSSAEYRLVDTQGRTIGTVDDARVFSVAHPGAVYLHQGRQYRVEELDMRERAAHVDDYDDADEFTQPRTETDIAIVSEDAFTTLGDAIVHLGSVEVTNRVVAYQRKQVSTNQVIEVCELELPERALSTRACWYTVDDDILAAAGVEPAQVIGTVHAAEHGLIGMLPLFTICDRWDVGGVSMAHHPQTGRPTIFVYDGYPGGAGIAELAYEAAARHAAETLALVESCPCDDGCPSCVQSPKCGNWNEYLDKRGAVALLGLMARAVLPRG
jgi:DEAD/DEAH box helicase domain-containing protein